MRRARNLAIFGIGMLLLAGAVIWTFRAQLAPALGVNADIGPGGRAELVVPSGYVASVFAEGLANPRFMAVSPEGALLVAERGADRVVALPDADGDGLADEIVEVGTEYDNAHDIEFTDDGLLIVGGETAIFEVALDGLREASRRVLIDDLPTGGHGTKTVEVLPGGGILVSIGSSCNACDEEDDRRATVQLLTDDGLRPYMVGLRNAVGLWVDDETGIAWATNMGRDLLGDDSPPETIYQIIDGADAGWPRCHAATIRDPEFGEAEDACEGVVVPALTLPAHVAPLALAGWEDRLVVALHGSWNSSSKVGYAVWWLAWDGAPAGEPEPLATGFLLDGATGALGRPAGLAVGADGALYVSDDKAGFIYRIARTGVDGGG